MCGCTNSIITTQKEVDLLVNVSIMHLDRLSFRKNSSFRCDV
jgi:hypothetical protein